MKWSNQKRDKEQPKNQLLTGQNWKKQKQRMITKQVPPPYQQGESCLKHLETKSKIYLNKEKIGFCEFSQS